MDNCSISIHFHVIFYRFIFNKQAFTQGTREMDHKWFTLSREIFLKLSRGIYYSRATIAFHVILINNQNTVNDKGNEKYNANITNHIKKKRRKEREKRNMIKKEYLWYCRIESNVISYYWVNNVSFLRQYLWKCYFNCYFETNGVVKWIFYILILFIFYTDWWSKILFS